MWFFYVVSRLPLGILYGISHCLYFLLRYVFKYRLQVVRNNLSRSFPTKSEEEIYYITDQFYLNTADMIVETIKLLTMSEGELNKRVLVKNEQALLKHFTNNTSVLLTACHQFNWEWMVAVGRTKLGYPFNPAYRPLKNKFFNHLIVTIRSRFGGESIVDKDLKAALKRNEGPIGYSLVMDHLSGRPFCWKTFLNQETLFDNSVEHLARLSQLPVVYPKLKKLKRGYYEVELIPLGEPPYEDSTHLLDTFVKEVERSIQTQPETWMWTHRRWKYRKEKLPVLN